MIQKLIHIRKRLLHQCHVILSPGIWKTEIEKRFGCPVRYNVCGLAMLPKTDAQKRTKVEVTMSSQIEKLNGNIAKPLVSCCYGH